MVIILTLTAPHVLASLLNWPTSKVVPQVNENSENSAKPSTRVQPSASHQRNRLRRRRTSQKGYSSSNVSATQDFSAPLSRASKEGHTNYHSQKHPTDTLLHKVCPPSSLKRTHNLSGNTTSLTAKRTSSSRWAFRPKSSGLNPLKSTAMEPEDSEDLDKEGLPSQLETPLTGKSERSSKFSKYLKRYAKGSVENLRARAQPANRLSRFEGSKKMLTRVKSMLLPGSGDRSVSNPEPFNANIMGKAGIFSTTEKHGPDYPFSEAVQRRTVEGRNLAARKVRSLTGDGFIKRKPVPIRDPNKHTDEKEHETHDQPSDIESAPYVDADDGSARADDASTVYYPTDVEKKAADFEDESEEHPGLEHFDEHAAADGAEGSVTASDETETPAADDETERDDIPDTDDAERLIIPEHSDTASSVDSNERHPKYSALKSGLRQHPNVMEFASPPGVVDDEPLPTADPEPESESESENESTYEPELTADAELGLTPYPTPEPEPNSAREPTPRPTPGPSTVRFPFDIYVSTEPSSSSNVSYAPSYFGQRSTFDPHLSTNDEVYRFLKQKALAKENGQDETVVDFASGDLGNRVTICHPTGDRPQSFSATIECTGEEPIAGGSGANNRASVQTTSSKGKRPASEVFHSADEGDCVDRKSDSHSSKRRASFSQSFGPVPSPQHPFDDFSHRTMGLEDPFLPDEPVILETVLSRPEAQGQPLISPYRFGRSRRCGWVVPEHFKYEEYEKWDVD